MIISQAEDCGIVQTNKVLITGISGSGGSYLADYILENNSNVEVRGFSRWHSMLSSYVDKRIQLHEVDLMDLSSILRAFNKFKPDAIFHMASHANVRACFDTPLSVIQNNVMGTANLLEAVRLSEIKPTFIMCSSSEVYGQVSPIDIPINENCLTKPSSPYAVSKLTQDALAQSYFLSYNIPVIRTRMFSYFNPRRKDLFSSSFARQVVEIERGQRKELIHGNLDSVRTMIDIRDACSAYWWSLYCQPGEAYNIGGDATTTVGDFLELLKKHAKVPIQSRVDPELIRPSDVTLQIPDTRKFRIKTNWRPRYSLDDSVNHLLEFYRGS